MHAVKRKRVTRVGSGAYSIYLPKKWIDAWEPAQRERREVDLHMIGGSLLVVPVLRERRFAGAAPTDPGAVRARLASGYVRGANEMALTPAQGKFGPDAIAAAREFLRHLDARIQPRVGPDGIGFHLQQDLPAPFASGTDLLLMMASKLRDILELAAECVEGYGAQPERVAESARLLDSMHEEELSRLYLQAIRLVATLELPLESVSDFQLLDLVAAELHDMGRQGLAIAETVLVDHGVGRPDLAYPSEAVVQRMAAPTVSPFARRLLQDHLPAFATAQTLLSKLADGLRGGSPDALRAIAPAARGAQVELHARLFAAVAERLAQAPSQAGLVEADVAYRLLSPVANMLDAVARAADRAAMLVAPPA